MKIFQRFLFILSKIMQVLPLRYYSALGDFLGIFWFYAIRFRRKIVLENLSIAYQHELTPLEIDQIARKNFCHYGRLLFETVYFLSWDAEKLKKSIPVEGFEHLQTSSKGGFFLTAHLGNWEVMASLAGALGVPMQMLVKKIRVRFLQDFIEYYRSKTGCGIIYESKTTKEIQRALVNGSYVAIMMDQFMGPPIGVLADFFGKPAGSLVALALFSEREEYPIFPVVSVRDAEGNLKVKVFPALEVPSFEGTRNERIIQKVTFFNSVLESIIRQYPDQWLWIHRRWKPFNGVSRWGALSTAALLLFLLVGCVTAPPTPTGIEVPPPPEVSIPDFYVEEVEDEDWDPDKAPKPIPVQVVEKAETKKGTKTKKVMKQSADSEVKRLRVVPAGRIPFAEGEKMEIDLNWSSLNAGRLTLEVKPHEKFGGRKTFLLTGSAVSSKLVDAFYHMENSVETIVDSTALIPYEYTLHQIETPLKRETQIRFDHPKSKAFFYAKRISQKMGNEEVSRVDVLSPQARDLFGGLYYMRVLNYVLNKTNRFTVYENGVNWDVELLPVANELVPTKAGSFQCWKVKVIVKLNNVLRPTGDWFIWLSDDSKKYFVKFEAKLKWGSLVGILVSVKDK